MTMICNAKLSVECLSYMMAEGGWKTVWKRLELIEEVYDGDIPAHAKLVSPYQRHFSWEPGWAVAEDSKVWLDNSLQSRGAIRSGKFIIPELVYEGLMVEGAAIHVYFNKPEDRVASSHHCYTPVRAHWKDFIAAGYEGEEKVGKIVAAFGRVYLAHADCELAIKTILEQRDEMSRRLRPNKSAIEPSLRGIPVGSSHPSPFSLIPECVQDASPEPLKNRSIWPWNKSNG